jgi:hypothetical protein
MRNMGNNVANFPYIPPIPFAWKQAVKQRGTAQYLVEHTVCILLIYLTFYPSFVIICKDIKNTESQEKRNSVRWYEKMGEKSF